MILSIKESNDINRQLWVIRGVLDHKLDENILNLIVKKHEKIDTFPKGYY